MDEWTLAAAKCFDVDNLTADWLYDWLPACNNGYPLTKNQQVVFV